MTAYVKLGIASRTLGVKRSLLQKLIHDGELPSFEGQVDLDLLKERFPALAMERNRAVSEVEHIRASAFGRRVSAVVTPDSDELENRLKRAQVRLEVEKGNAKRNRELLDHLLHKLAEMQASDDPVRRETVREINQWLVQAMRQ